MAKYEGIVRNSKGDIVPTPSVAVYDGGTSNLSSIFSDRAMTAVLSNPFSGESDGSYEFFVQPAEYKIVVSKPGYNNYSEDYVTIGLADEHWTLDTNESTDDLEITDRSTSNAVVILKDGADADTLTIDADGNIGINTTDYGSGQGVVALANAVVPPTVAPSGGGVLYSSSGIAKWIRSDGSVDNLTGIETSDSLYYDTYHPDRPPTAGEVESDQTDEFNNGALGTWAWGNQGGASIDAEWDLLKLTMPGETGDKLRGYFLPHLASMADHIVVVKMTARWLDGNFAGICLLSGTLATPTQIDVFGLTMDAAGGAMDLQNALETTYTDAPSWSNVPVLEAEWNQPAVYLAYKYTNSSKLVEHYFSLNGYSFNKITSDRTFSADPDFVGVAANSGNAGSGPIVRYNFFRTMSSAAGLAFQIGEAI